MTHIHAAAFRRLLCVGALAIFTLMAVWAAPAQTPAALTTRQDLQLYLAEKLGQTMPTMKLSATGMDYDACMLQYKSIAADTRVVTRLLVFHLQLADQLLATGGREQQQTCAGIALAAMQCAGAQLKDHLLALGIGNVYLLPNIEMFNDDSAVTGRRNVMMQMAQAVKYAGTPDALAQVYTRTLQVVSGDCFLNATRYKLALTDEALQRYQDGIVALDAISDPATRAAAASLRAELVQKLGGAK